MSSNTSLLLFHSGLIPFYNFVEMGDRNFASLVNFIPVHRGAFFQFPLWWIYYYGSNKSTGKETGKRHLYAVIGTNLKDKISCL